MRKTMAKTIANACGQKQCECLRRSVLQTPLEVGVVFTDPRHGASSREILTLEDRSPQLCERKPKPGKPVAHNLEPILVY